MRLDGQVRLLGAESKLFLEAKDGKLQGTTSTNLFNAVRADVTVKSSGLSLTRPSGFSVQAEMVNDFRSRLSRRPALQKLIEQGLTIDSVALNTSLTSAVRDNRFDVTVKGTTLGHPYSRGVNVDFTRLEDGIETVAQELMGFASVLETMPATKITTDPNCKAKFPASGKWDAAFLHVWNNTCWSCPKGYRRTANANVAGDLACRRPRETKHTAATKRGKASGRRKNKCSGGQFSWRKNCYSCPGGYKRNLARYPTHAKHCEKVIAGGYAKATERGDPGCPDGTFRRGAIRECYGCPSGFKLNPAVVGDPTTNERACISIALGKK